VDAVPAPRQQMIEKYRWSFVSGESHFVKCQHSSTGAATGMVFSRDGYTFVTRSDDSVCLWDLRNPKQVVKTLTQLPNNFAKTQITFSPGEETLMTGTSALNLDSSNVINGNLCFIDRKTFQLLHVFETHGSAIQSLWHTKTNQILVAGGSRNEGYVKVYHNTLKSFTLSRKKTSVKPDSYIWNDTPKTFSLITNRIDHNEHRKKIISKLKNIYHKPNIGMASYSPGHSGRIGISKTSLLAFATSMEAIK
jgi:WD40 repeat protein